MDFIWYVYNAKLYNTAKRICAWQLNNYIFTFYGSNIRQINNCNCF